MMRRSDADESAAGIGIEMRSALAHQIRCPEQAFGARWCGRSFFGEKFVRITVAVGRGSGVEAESVAEPAKRKPSGLRDAHNVPAAGNGVTKGVQAAARVERGTIRGGENDAGSADGGADGSSANDAVPTAPAA